MPSLRQISRIAKDGSYAQRGLGFESSNNVLDIIATKRALPSADGRQSRQPITCASAGAGSGITSKKWTKVTV